MIKLEITIHGTEESDLVIALEEITKQIEQGYKEGFNENDTADFKYITTKDAE